MWSILSEKKDKEIDWDAILKGKASIKDVPAEKVVLELDRMRRKTDALPRWHYFKMLVILIDLIVFVGVSAYMEIHKFPYFSTVVVFVLVQVYLLIDHFVLIYRATKRD